jgi:hypothetical protein
MPFQPDQAHTMTAIALAESAGRDTNVPYVLTRVATQSPQAPTGEDSRGLWHINQAPADGSNVAITYGSGSPVDMIEVLGSTPPVFDFLL